MKTILIKTEFINLTQFLKMEAIISSGGEVKYFLEENEIYLNDIKVSEKRKKMYSGDVLKINNDIYRIESENK